MMFTKPQVLRRLQALVDQHRNAAQAAKALGVTHSELANALADRVPIPPKLRKAIGVERVTVYVDKLENKYLDGSQRIE